MRNKLIISIYSHEDEFIELLYDNKREFEGQLMEPQITLNKNGTKSLQFSIPIRIFNRATNNFIENPRWDYIVHQYKIRVEEDDLIQEFICNNYTESRSNSNQIIVNVNCISLAEFELSQIGYSLSFGENDLNKYEEGIDPNDADAKPIGVYDGDIYFWENKLLDAINLNADGKFWNFDIESYYIIDEECFDDERQKIDLYDPEVDESLHTGYKQFYENNRIIGYTDDGDKIYSDQYAIKKRIIQQEKSSVWNIQQAICETFECWPEFIYEYENNKIKNRKIVLKNDLPTYGNFTIEYRKNLNSLNRTVDASKVITKMYVNDIENENSDSGLVSIADNEANYTGENYLLDLDWYLGELEDDDLKSKDLINPNLSYTFKKSDYINKIDQDIVANNTKELIEKYKENLRFRNQWIRSKSLEVTKMQEELSVLLERLEFFTSSYESAKENYTTYYKKWFEKTKSYSDITINKDCFVQKDGNGALTVTFSEEGIKPEEFEKTMKTIVSSVNIKDIKKLSYEIIEVEPITNTIKRIQLSGIDIINENKVAYFTIKLLYHPLEFYRILCEYWQGKMKEDQYQIDLLGKTSEEWKEYKADLDIELHPENSNSYGQQIIKKETELKALKAELFSGQCEKQEMIKEVEYLLKPYIREGYWEDSNYSIYPNKEKIINNIKFINERDKAEGTSISASKETWDKQDSHLNYFIPNYEITNIKGEKKWYSYLDKDDNIMNDKVDEEDIKTTQLRKLYLYDVIDIDTIEISTADPNLVEDDALYLTFNKGSDFNVEFGCCPMEWAVNQSDGSIIFTDESKIVNGLYIRFNYDNLYDTKKWQLTKSDMVFIRARAKGSNQYIQLIAPTKQHSNNLKGWDTVKLGTTGWWIYPVNDGQHLAPFCPINRTYTIHDHNIIQSSVNMTLYSEQLLYDIETNTTTIDPIKYDLTFGKDFYLDKQTDDQGETFTKINITNSLYSKLPIIGSDNSMSWIAVEYKTDATAHYYFNDAMDVFEDYKKPEVNYTVSIVDLSKAQATVTSYENLKPVVGTKVAIWDKEMHFNGNLGLIDSITFDLLNPQNTQVNVTSYKNKFEDLFQKITAATVAMENKEYNYDRASELVDTTSTAKIYDLMTNALKEADNALSLSDDANIIYDKKGITLESENVNENGVKGKIRLTSNGIFLSNSQSETGSEAWTTAITPDFINADLLRAGHIDTRSISIWNDTAPTFLWNEDGIYAYGKDKRDDKVENIDENIFVRFNKDGLVFRNQDNLEEPVIVKNELTTDVTMAQDGQRKDIHTWTVNINDLPFTEDRKYFYRFKFKISNADINRQLDEDEILHFYIGFDGNLDTFDSKDTSRVSFDNGEFNIDISNFIVAQKNSAGAHPEFKIIVIRGRLLDTTGAAIQLSYDFEQVFLCDIDTTFNHTIPIQEELVELIDDDAIIIKKYGVDEKQKVYYDAVTLDWDGFKYNSLKNNLILGEDGLLIQKDYGNGEKINLIQLGWIDQENNKYGLIGKNKIGDIVFRLDEDGLILAGDFSGSNLYGGSLNIGGFYKSRAKHSWNKGYNFQVDETGLLKARKFELYPRSGVAEDATFTSVDYEQYRGSYQAAMQYRKGNIIKYGTRYYQVHTDFITSITNADDKNFDLTKFCSTVAVLRAIPNDGEEDDLFVTNNKVYKIIKSWNGTITFDNAKSKKYIKEITVLTYGADQTIYYPRDTFYHNDKNGIAHYYVVIDKFTLTTFEDDSSHFKEIQISKYDSTKTYEQGDIVVGYKNYVYAMYDKDNNEWIECKTGYGEGSGVEFDKPFVKMNYKDNVGSLDFYNNSIQTKFNEKPQTILTHIGEDFIGLYDRNGAIKTEINVDGITFYCDAEDHSKYAKIYANEDEPSKFELVNGKSKDVNGKDVAEISFSVCDTELLFIGRGWSDTGGLQVDFPETDLEGQDIQSARLQLFSNNAGRCEIYSMKMNNMVEQLQELIISSFPGMKKRNINSPGVKMLCGPKLAFRTNEGVRGFNIGPGLLAEMVEGNLYAKDSSDWVWDITQSINLIYNTNVYKGGIQIGYNTADKTTSATQEGRRSYNLFSAQPILYYTDEVTGKASYYNGVDTIKIGSHHSTGIIALQLKRRQKISNVPNVYKNVGFIVQVAEDDNTVPATIFAANETGLYYGGNAQSRVICSPRAKKVNSSNIALYEDEFIKADEVAGMDYRYEIGSIGYDYTHNIVVENGVSIDKGERGFYIVKGTTGEPVYIGGSANTGNVSVVSSTATAFLNINGGLDGHKAAADATCKLSVNGNIAANHVYATTAITTAAAGYIASDNHIAINFHPTKLDGGGELTYDSNGNATNYDFSRKGVFTSRIVFQDGTSISSRNDLGSGGGSNVAVFA